MRYPSSTDLKELHGRSPSWYAAWLRIGLAEYQFERKGGDAFPGAEKFIDQHEAPVAGELRQVALALPERDKEAFKQGVAQLLQSLDFADPHDATIALSVMQLGAGIGSLGLLGILSSKSFSLTGDHGARLYDLAFDLAAHLPDLEPDDTIRCLKQLIRHRRLFQPATVGRALIAMTQAKADAFPDHFKCLRPVLDEQYGYVLRDDMSNNDMLSDEERKRARLRKRLVDGLMPLFRDVSLLTQGSELPLWWLDALGEHAPQAFPERSATPGDVDARESDDGLAQPAASRSTLLNWALGALESALIIREGRDPKAAGSGRQGGTFFDPSQTGAEELATGLGDLGDLGTYRPSHISTGESADVCG